jgi:hypothetical protein
MTRYFQKLFKEEIQVAEKSLSQLLMPLNFRMVFNKLRKSSIQITNSTKGLQVQTTPTLSLKIKVNQ